MWTIFMFRDSVPNPYSAISKVFKIMSKPSKKYSIVEFPDGLQIIPSCWINTQNNESIWPSYVKSRQALDKLLTKAVVPVETNKWDTCKIRRIFGSADTWERAQEKLVEAIDTSTVYDSDDFSEKEWRSRKKKQRRDNAKKIKYSSHSSEDEEASKDYHKVSKRTFSQDLSQLPLLPEPPVISLSSQSSEATTSKAIYQAQNSETLPYMPNKSTSPCTLHHFRNFNSSKEGIQSDCNVDDLFPNDFRNFMIKSMVTLLRRTKSLDDRISKIEIKEKQVEIEEYNEEEFAFPFQTEEQLFEFEKKLENPMFFKKMIFSLKIIGGNKINIATNAILGKLIANKLATKYSWHGRKGKKVFSELKISKLIIKTVHMMCEKNCTDAQIVEAVSTWLAQAPTRLKRAQARTCLQEQNFPEDREYCENEDNIEN